MFYAFKRKRASQNSQEKWMEALPHYWKSPYYGEGKKTVSVPIHGNKSLGKGLENKLLKQTGLEK